MLIELNSDFSNIPALRTPLPVCGDDGVDDRGDPPNGLGTIHRHISRSCDAPNLWTAASNRTPIRSWRTDQLATW